MPKKWTFDGIDNKCDVYRGEDCIKKVLWILREYAMKLINFKMKKMIPLTSKDYESYHNQANCHIWKKSLKINTLLIKIIVKLETTAIFTGKYRGTAHSICNLKYIIPKEILVVFQNASNKIVWRVI